MIAGGHNYITEAHGTWLWEGDILGNNHELVTASKRGTYLQIIRNDRLSLIVLTADCKFTIWEDYEKGGDSDTFSAEMWTPRDPERQIHGARGEFENVGNDEASTITCSCRHPNYIFY